MSGQATGWVLKHGPQDRAMRAVLITIADAANADGQHAHPGIRAMVGGSLYSERTVQSTVLKLIDKGWVEIEETGGGRGKATVYRVLMQTPQSSHPLLEETPQKPRNLSVETPQSSLPTLSSATNSTATRRRRAPELPLPDDFTISEPMKAWVFKNHYEYLDIQLETEKFRNHAEANDRRCRNWVAAWRNWIIGAATRTPKADDGDADLWIDHHGNRRRG